MYVPGHFYPQYPSPCPSCGYCPHCGQHKPNFQPYYQPIYMGGGNSAQNSPLNIGTEVSPTNK